MKKAYFCDIILANSVVLLVLSASTARMVIPTLVSKVINDGIGDDRKSLFIAGVLVVIRDSQMILYMENGDIKEVGDHDTLMAQNGKYAALYNSQFA